MKIIYKLAKTELKTLFFSPIAWLIMVIFTFQVGLAFTDLFADMIKYQTLGWSLFSATISTFAKSRGLFSEVQQYLYLYIPLLTMGVMSREFSSGSIKLLYSSPLSGRQIVLGKYLALVIYALVLIAVLAVFGAFGAAVIRSADIPVVLTGLFGLFLLICAYASIGLFMSSLTSYTVVSAMGTLAVFALLSYVKGVGQDIEIIRDITYWLAISNRCNTFVSGMITSEDFLYFVIIIVSFLSFTVIKLNASRQKQSAVVTTGKYLLVGFLAVLIGYFSAKPVFMTYLDVTRTKVNTLTKSSQKVISQLRGDMTIHTYTNMLEENFNQALPEIYKRDVDRFKQYTRFKPEIKMKYTYYYHDVRNPQLETQYPGMTARQRIDTLTKLYGWKFKIYSYDEIKDQVDLASENFRFVRSLEHENGKQTFLRLFDDMTKHPSETEITAAFKRLAMETLPTVGFLTGHGERESNSEADRGYNMFAQEKTYRYALINQGFNFENVTLDKEIPEYIRILLIAEVRKPVSAEEQARLDRYIQKGGDLIIAGEPGRQQYMNPLVESLGVRFKQGTLVTPNTKLQPDLVLVRPTREATGIAFHFSGMRRNQQVLPLSVTSALELEGGRGFKMTTLFKTDSAKGWNELETTDFVDDTLKYNPQTGEEKGSFPVAVALSRRVNNNDQKIVVLGDADWLSNGELMMNRKDIKAANFSLFNGLFFWMTDEELPIDMRRPTPPDSSLRIAKDGWAVYGILLKWILPLLLAFAGLFIWIRRKSR